MHRISYCALLLLLASCAAAPDAVDRATETVHAEFRGGVARLLARVEALDSVARMVPNTPEAGPAVRTAFEGARDAWKRVEFLVEHYLPSAADELNGPAIDEIEPFDPNRIVVPAEGFQVIEEYLYPELDPSSADELIEETARLLAVVRRVAQYAEATPFTADNIWEAARLEIVRIMALGISGFDSPVALRSLAEAAVATSGIRAGLVPFLEVLDGRDRTIARALDRRLAAMEDALRANPEFERFDRLSFIREHLHPTFAALADARDALGIHPPRGPRALRADARTLFAAESFDTDFFAAPGTPPATPALVALGSQLFLDPVLSAGASRSCAECHKPHRAFTDGLARSRPLASSPDAVLRNAPTLLNAGLQVGSFYDLRTEFLEDQVAEVVHNRDEMHGDLQLVAELVDASAAYDRVLNAIPLRDAPVDALLLRRALAAYMRSLISLDSRIDRYLRGEDVELTPDEIAGFNLFMGKARCGTCHFAPLFNGSLPPAWRKTDIEILGVPATSVGTDVDTDSGAFHVRGNPLHLHGFKTPTVRNVALTSPYMHNGVYATLEEVIDFYDIGGGAGLGIVLGNQTLPPDSLRLTDGEKRALVRFLEALTDTSRVFRAVED